MEKNMHCQTTQTKDISIKRLSMQEILSIYTVHSIRHFPENERKPVSSIERMAQEGIYKGYGLFFPEDADLLIGYAFFTLPPERETSLLDYFAIMEDYRSCGVGSLFLQHMKSVSTDYSGFLIESEDPDYAKDPQEHSVRSKRLSFYNKNGAISTGITATVFGVPYRLLYFPLTAGKIPPTDQLVSDFSNIYRHMVSPVNFKSNIQICPPKASH